MKTIIKIIKSFGKFWVWLFSLDCTDSGYIGQYTDERSERLLNKYEMERQIFNDYWKI